MRGGIPFVAAALMSIVMGCGTREHPTFSAFQKTPLLNLPTFKTHLKQDPQERNKGTSGKRCGNERRLLY